ncbi:MAG: DsbE family thiol:disulfide interchange protein [Polynucleobacter sp.]|jgi:cytochrome c biogenesis protein CcmG/thiol:disulfide interchange protein DsbE|nr:DsbE family thiol:disulfide interchange protein [Polynucleobacter sp.]MDZ4057154.1 DsbE family thiol:disulfide interchange protein [Polynucleobacter sp.]
MKRYLIPLGIFIVLLGFLAVGLQLNPREVPSPLINKSAPLFNLPVLGKEGTTFSPEEMRGKVWVLNVWASWCVACREEHPYLVDFAKTQTTPLLGLDYKDKPEDALRWLKEHGNPYVLSISDLKGQVGIDYGVYGVPETFVIDQAGVIRLKHIGPLTPQAIQEKILPLIQKLNS